MLIPFKIYADISCRSRNLLLDPEDQALVKDLVVLIYKYNFNINTFTCDYVMHYGDLPYHSTSSEVTVSREMRYLKAMVLTHFFCQKDQIVAHNVDLEDFDQE